MRSSSREAFYRPMSIDNLLTHVPSNENGRATGRFDTKRRGDPVTPDLFGKPTSSVNLANT